MGQFLNSITDVKRNYNIYDKWEQQQADEKAQKVYLAQNLTLPKDKLDLTEARAKTVIRATEMLDNRSENNCEDMELCTSMISAFAAMPVALLPLAGLNFKSQKAVMLLNIGSLIAAFGLGIGLTLWGTSKQKEASRIGRFQAKQNELKDVKNFVIYTPEQISAAIKKAESLPLKKEEAKSFLKSYSNIKSVFKDKAAYQKWQSQKDNGEIDRLKSKNYSALQLKLAEDDKELIVDAVKDINIKTEEYSENVENAYDTLGVFSFVAAAPVAMVLNKILKMFGGNVAKYSKVISIAASTIASISILSAGTLEQKEAARIGRFKARQELLKNPAALLSFTDEEKEQAKDVKAENQKIPFFKKIAGSFTFLAQYAKDKIDYKIYKENELRKNEQIIKILKEETPLTEKQLKDAKHLQEKVFMAFDEIDEMSQRYSEDVEAGTEIAKNAFGAVFGILYGLGSAVLAMAFVTGKVPIDKIIKKFSDFTIDKNSPFRKLVDEGYKLLKNDKDLRKAFNGFYLGDKKLSEKLDSNEEFQKIFNAGKAEFAKLSLATGNKKLLLEAMEPHFKKGFFAKWGRNFAFDIGKLKIKSQLKQSNVETPDWLQFNYKNYQTLWNTSAVAGIPVTGLLIGIPYSFNAWLTSIQKKAGKIGIMKAMEKVDDARLFVNENEPETSAPIPQSPVAPQGNLLDKFKH